MHSPYVCNVDVSHIMHFYNEVPKKHYTACQELCKQLNVANDVTQDETQCLIQIVNNEDSCNSITKKVTPSVRLTLNLYLQDNSVTSFTLAFVGFGFVF